MASMEDSSDRALIPLVVNDVEYPNLSQIDPRFLIDPTMTKYTEPPNLPETFGDSVNAIRDGFYRGNILLGPMVEAVQKDLDSDLYPPVDGYNFQDDPQLDGMEQFLFNFYGSLSPRETQARLYRLNQRLDEQAKQGAWNAFGYFVGATLDPLYAAGFLASQTRTGRALLNNVKRNGAFGAAVGFSAESVRAGLEPAFAESIDALLGATFGAAGGTLIGVLRRADNRQLANAAAAYRAEVDATSESVELALEASQGRTMPDWEAARLADEAADEAAKLEASQGRTVPDWETGRRADEAADEAAKLEASDGRTMPDWEAARRADDVAAELDGDFVIGRGADGRILLDPILDDATATGGPVGSSFPMFNPDGKLVRARSAASSSPEIDLNIGFRNIKINDDGKGGVYSLLPDTPGSTVATIKFEIIKDKPAPSLSTRMTAEEIEAKVNDARGGRLEVIDPASGKMPDERSQARMDSFREAAETDLIAYAEREGLEYRSEGILGEGRVEGPDATPTTASEGIPIKSLSAGAAEEGATAPTVAQRLAGEEPVEAFGLEKLPNNPVKRVLQSFSPRARDLVSEMLEISFFQKKHFEGIRAQRSIERAVIASRTVNADLIIHMRSLYDKYVMRVLGRDLNITERLRGNTRVISYAEFRRQVTLARFNGNRHSIDEVREGGKYVGDKIYDPLARRAEESDIYADQIEQEIMGLERDSERGPNKDGFYSVQTSQSANRLITEDQLIQSLASLRSRLAAFRNGTTTGTRKNYVNIVFRRDKIKGNREGILSILRRLPGMDRKAANELIDRMLLIAPYADLGPDSTGMASAFRTRELFKNDTDLKTFLELGGDKFIETDIIALARYYQRTFGTDLDIYEKFGSIEMYEQINQVRAEYQELIDRLSPDPDLPDPDPRRVKVRELESRLARDLNDIRAMRDLLRGTYGLPADPNSGFSTAIRVFKRANAITMLTGFAAAIPDIGRIVMTEGLKETVGPLLRDFRTGFSSVKLSLEDTRMAGEVFDMILGTRAAMMADIGDGVGLASTFEGISAKAADFTFSYVNMLNPWTDLMKTATGTIVGHRVIRDSALLTLGKLDDLGIAKLARGGIDADLAKRISVQFLRYGQKMEDTDSRIMVARTNLWDDEGAKQAFGDALSRDVSRAIVTPGLGDPPLWMNTEWGGLIGQFKKFSTGAFERVTVAGLQERNMAVMHGTIVMVGIGMLIDHFRAGQIGLQDQDIGDYIVGGIDRSGVLGWVGDVVHAAETIVDPNAGGRNVAGVILGPSGSQVFNLGEIFYSMTDSGDTGPTSQNVRRMLPWQNVVLVDGIFDKLTGTP